MRRIVKWIVFTAGMLLVACFAYLLWTFFGAVLCAQGALSECIR